MHVENVRNLYIPLIILLNAAMMIALPGTIYDVHTLPLQNTIISPPACTPNLGFALSALDSLLVT